MIDRPLILLGAPGSGKGTLARIMNNIWHVPVICTGDLLRSRAVGDSPLAVQLREAMNSGQLVREELVNRVVWSRLAEEDCSDSFILDGYPRSESQAQFLDGLVRKLGMPTPAVVELVVPPSVLCARMTGRLQCVACGAIYNLHDRRPAHPGVCDHDGMFLTRRADDEMETILNRLRVYEQMITPLSRYCQAHWDYHRVNGDQAPIEILEQVQEFLMSSTVPPHVPVHTPRQAPAA